MNRAIILKELDAAIANRCYDEMYINKLNNNKDKVKYLRIVKNYTQAETANIIGISERQVQRIEKYLKKI